MAARIYILLIGLFIVGSLNGQIDLPDLDCSSPIDITKYFEKDARVDSFDLEIICGTLQLLDRPMDSTIYKKTSKLCIRFGKLRYKESNYKTYILFRNAAAQIAFKYNDLKIYISSLNKIAIANYRIGDHYESFEMNLKALSLARVVNDSFLIRSVLHRQSWIYWKLERYDEAIQSMEEYKDISQKLNPKSKRYLYSYFNGLASFYHSKGEEEHARFLGDSAIYYAVKLNNKKSIGLALSNKVMYYPKGSTDDIKQRLLDIERALIINHEMKDKEQLGSNYGVLATVQKNNQNYQESIKAFSTSLEYASAIGDLPRVNIAYDGLAAVYDSIRDYSNAYHYKKLNHELHKQLYGAKNINQIFDLEKENADNQARQQINLLEVERKQSEVALQKQKFNFLLLALGLMTLLFGAIFYNYRQRQKQELNEILMAQKATEQIRSLEKTALRSQMNPHFIFNSLNSIKSYIATNEPRIATRFLNKFAQLMRIILSNSQEHEVPLSQEIKALDLYIELEQFRLENGFSYAINVDSAIDLDEYLVPPLIIQPYVENAIWHGLVNIQENRKLEIDVSIENDLMQIIISDNGIGRVAAEFLNKNKPSQYKSYGMKITKDRLKLNDESFSEETNIKILDKVDAEGNSCGTEVKIYLPLKPIKYEN